MLSVSQNLILHLGQHFKVKKPPYGGFFNFSLIEFQFDFLILIVIFVKLFFYKSGIYENE